MGGGPGVRGMVDKKSVCELLNFLRVPRERCARIVEDVALESVKALYSLHQIRCQALRLNMQKAITRTRRGASSGNASASRHGTFDTNDPSASCNRKRRRRADDDYGETRRRWKKMANDARGRG